MKYLILVCFLITQCKTRGSGELSSELEDKAQCNVTIHSRNSEICALCKQTKEWADLYKERLEKIGIKVTHSKKPHTEDQPDPQLSTKTKVDLKYSMDLPGSQAKFKKAILKLCDKI